MSVSGVCQHCESARAEYRCESCGALVCADHFEPAMGACVECARPGGRRL